MTVIVCEVEDLSRGRLGEIRERLKLVSGDYLHIEPRSLQTLFEITATHGDPHLTSRRDWTFPSTVDSIVCQYRELWTPIGPTEQTYRLANIQFQLLQHRGPDESPIEIVAFHWHPATSVENGERHYNHRPHLHLSVAPDPLPKSHLGVTLAVAIDHQATVEYLDRLLDEAIGMVAVEVLDLLASTSLTLP